MDTPVSISTVEASPETGAKLSLVDREEAFAQMEKDTTFIKKLTLAARFQASAFGLADPFSEGALIAGWHTPEDIAWEAITSVLEGKRKWDREKFPIFYIFCKLQIKSIIANALSKLANSRVYIESPISEEDPETGDFSGTRVSEPKDPLSLPEFLISRDNRRIAESFLQDFALFLPEDSTEQKIVMRILDDSQCTGRAYCIASMGLDGSEYDAAFKRLQRKLKDFKDSWMGQNGISENDWRNLP